MESSKWERLSSLSICLGSNNNSLICGLVDRLLNHGIDFETKAHVLKIIKRLKEPFLYVKNPIGENEAKKERIIRENIIKNLKEAFFLE